MKTFLPAFTKEEERRCIERLMAHDKGAKQDMILHNMRLVAHVVKRYASKEQEKEDLISIGTIGLMKAVDTFDERYKNSFATYAIRCIENEILMYLRAKKKQRQEVSIYEPIGMDKEGNQIHLLEILVKPEKDIVEQLESEQLIRILWQNMRAVLSPREYLIVCKRFGILGEKEKTQREIAKEMNISRSYVSRIEKKALVKLRDFIDSKQKVV